MLLQQSIGELSESSCCGLTGNVPNGINGWVDLLKRLLDDTLTLCL